MAELGLSLNQLVELNLPAGFVVKQDFIDNSTKVWQMYLWNLFKDYVAEEDKYSIEMYPEESLPFFASLVIYDVMRIALNADFLDLVGAGEDAQGGVKKITTGPTDVEWHDTTSALAKLINAVKEDGGLVAYFSGQACMFARQWGIKLPFCRPNSAPFAMFKMKGLQDRDYSQLCKRVVSKG